MNKNKTLVTTLGILALTITCLVVAKPTLAQSKKPLTNADVVQMVKAGFDEQTVVKAIQANETHFDVSPQALLARKDSGVGQKIIQAMLSSAAEENKPVSGLTPDAQTLIETFNWPGNVRQLENTIFRAVVLCDGDILDVCDFPQIAAAMGVDAAPRKPVASAQAPVHASRAAPAPPARIRSACSPAPPHPSSSDWAG